MIGSKPAMYYSITWRFLTPLGLVVSVTGPTTQYETVHQLCVAFKYDESATELKSFEHVAYFQITRGLKLYG